MIVNQASQKVGAQMITAADGTAFTGSVTVAVTIDAGTQATGSVGSGACAHEGGGYHTYSPAQAETNGALVAFTFTGTGAVPQTVQVYTRAATPDVNATQLAGQTITAAAGVTFPTSVASPTNITAGTITTVTNLTNAPTAGDLTATMKTSVTTAATAATPTAAAVTGAVGSVTGNVGGNVAGSVGSVTAGVTLANDAITAAKFDESTAFPLTSADTGSTAVARTGADSDTLETLSDQLDAKASQASVDDLPTNAELATSQAAADDATLAAIAALNNLSAAAVNAEVDTAISDAALATAANLATVAGYLDTEIADIKAVTDKVDDTLEDDGGTFRFTTNALEQGPGGGSAPTAADIADAVWLEAIADHSGTTGSTAEALNAAGAAGDPWTTALPGAYGSGSAGKIIGDNINATISSRASQTSVDDLPTNAELATSQAAADDATLAAIAALNNLSAAQVNTEVDTALADVGLTTTITGRIDAAVSTRATPAQVATELGTYDAPTKAELDAAVAPLATAANLTTVDNVVDAIKLKTDLIPSDPAETSDIPSAATIATAVLAAATANPIDANVQEINDVALTGDGSVTPWGPAA